MSDQMPRRRSWRREFISAHGRLEFQFSIRRTKVWGRSGNVMLRWWKWDDSLLKSIEQPEREFNSWKACKYFIDGLAKSDAGTVTVTSLE